MAYIKQKSNGSYLITVSCGRDSKDKKITRSTTFRPELFTSKGHPKSEKTIEKEVAAFAANFEKKVLTGTYTEGNTLTFEKYTERYLEEYATLFQAPRTLQSTKSTLKLFNADFGYMTLEALNPLFLQEYVNKMLKTKKASDKACTLSHGTVKRRMAVLSAALSQAVRWNLIDRNPMDHVMIKDTKKEATDNKLMHFTQEQAEIFLNALTDPLIYKYQPRSRKDNAGNIYQIQEYQTEHSIHLQLKLFFYLAMFTGCRRGELVALKWSDFDFTDSSISITKSTCRADGVTITKTTKTKGSIRTIAVPSVVMDIAKCWKTEQARYRLMLGSKWEGDKFVFIQWNGRQMGLETPYQAFRRIIDNYNSNRKENMPELPHIPLHGLRHTAATLLISQGVDIRTVSGRLGHSSTSTTLNIYSHALRELDKTASDKLENLLLRPAK